MAEGDGVVYNSFKTGMLNGLYDLGVANDVLKVALLTAYTPDVDADAVWGDISANEVSGGGYVADGETLANQIVAQDNANDRASWDADNVTWSSLDVGTPNRAVIVNVTATEALMGHFEIETASNGGDYTLTWHANGIMLLS